MKKGFYYSILILGILGIMDFIFLMIYSGIINLGVILPLVFGIIFILYSIMKLRGFKYIIKNKPLRIFITTGWLVFITSLIIVESVILFGTVSDIDKKVDYVLILGAGLKGDKITYTLKYRLDAGIKYLNQNPDTKVVVTGGQGANELLSEAEAMEGYLLRNGIENERIIKEDKSTSTIENILFSREKLIGEIGDTQINNINKIRVMIVTNDFHLYRAKLLAKMAGFKVYGIPAKSNPFIVLNCYLREYFAVVKLLLLDKANVDNYISSGKSTNQDSEGASVNLLSSHDKDSSTFGLFRRKGIEVADLDINADKDADGINDLDDFVQGARLDAKNKPKYKSAYYAGGYPPDDEGVCTDVIWRAFKNAGFLLKDMVDEDIRSNLKAYPRVEGKPDPNIDFRRVQNLVVFFKEHAQVLDTELIPEDADNLINWQRGDIIVLTEPYEHIGMLSDKRNNQGIPLVIHNGGPYTREEDVLSWCLKYDYPITWHFRYYDEVK